MTGSWTMDILIISSIILILIPIIVTLYKELGQRKSGDLDNE